MENTRHIELGRLLSAAARGRVAIFAMEHSEQAADRLVSCEPDADCPTTDIRGRLIYRLFKEYNEEVEDPDGLILDTDLDFSSKVEDKNIPVGQIKADIIPDHELGTCSVWYVRMSALDADFLLGVLPDCVMETTIERYLDAEGSY